jgi:phage FluMu protein Com
MDQASSRLVEAGRKTTELICPKCKARNSAEGDVCDFCGNSLAGARPFTTKSKAYICPTCNKLLDTIHGDAKKGVLCPSGHKVQEVPTLGFRASAVGGVVGGIIVWLITFYVPGWFPPLTALSGIFRVIFTGYTIFKAGQGVVYLRKPAPTKQLAYHLVGLNLGALVGFGVTAMFYYHR